MFTHKEVSGKGRFQNGITHRELFIQTMAGEIDYFSTIKIMNDEECYREYQSDTINVCGTCGVIPRIIDEPDEKFFSISVFDSFCKESDRHMAMFQKLAEDAESNMKQFFSNQIIDGDNWAFKEDGKIIHTILRYQNRDDLIKDLERIAMHITIEQTS